MANSEIAGLTEDTTPAETDNVYAQDAAGAVDKRVPVSSFATTLTDADKWWVPIRDKTGTVVGGIGHTDADNGVVIWRGAADVPQNGGGPLFVLGDDGSVYMETTSGEGTFAFQDAGPSALTALTQDLQVASGGTLLLLGTLIKFKTGAAGITGSATPATLTALADVLVALGAIASHSITNPVNPAGTYLPLVVGGAAVENIGAVESNTQTVGATGSTETLDTSVYGVFDMTMDQACTFTFSNPAPSGKASVFVLILRGAFTPTWPGSVDWSSATPPTYTTPSVYTFTTVDAGTTWLGAQVGKAFV